MTAEDRPNRWADALIDEVTLQSRNDCAYDAAVGIVRREIDDHGTIDALEAQRLNQERQVVTEIVGRTVREIAERTNREGAS